VRAFTGRLPVAQPALASTGKTCVKSNPYRAPKRLELGLLFACHLCNSALKTFETACV
jgi:hypothetical protein